MWCASVTRSLMKDAPERLTFEGVDGHMMTWWGPILPVKNGDTVLCFPTPLGVMVEMVEPAA
jgi:hypothetical protein